VRDGRHKDVFRPEKAGKVVFAKMICGEPVKVTRAAVKDFVEDPIFLYYLEIYHYTKLWGLPNGRGWANEPQDLLTAISAFEMESREIEAEEMEKCQNK